ncbi:hypothetical protein IWX49DRAFT_94300 [Phyllosticta citricarpa]|uniref:Secreted protein n=1 Tax=Phyllosticta citricarpa TaxID=55181 RepID=A0ABR1LEH5_9PEZI
MPFFLWLGVSYVRILVTTVYQTDQTPSFVHQWYICEGSTQYVPSILLPTPRNAVKRQPASQPATINHPVVHPSMRLPHRSFKPTAQVDTVHQVLRPRNHPTPIRHDRQTDRQTDRRYGHDTSLPHCLRALRR